MTDDDDEFYLHTHVFLPSFKLKLVIIYLPGGPFNKLYAMSEKMEAIVFQI